MIKVMSDLCETFNNFGYYKSYKFGKFLPQQRFLKKIEKFKFMPTKCSFLTSRNAA